MWIWGINKVPLKSMHLSYFRNNKMPNVAFMLLLDQYTLNLHSRINMHELYKKLCSSALQYILIEQSVSYSNTCMSVAWITVISTVHLLKHIYLIVDSLCWVGPKFCSDGFWNFSIFLCIMYYACIWHLKILILTALLKYFTTKLLSYY